jgi:hypothetical protein
MITALLLFIFAFVAAFIGAVIIRVFRIASLLIFVFVAVVFGI